MFIIKNLNISAAMLENLARKPGSIVQVYDLATGQYTRGVGGTACGTAAPNYLCKSVNALSFVPNEIG